MPSPLAFTILKFAVAASIIPVGHAALSHHPRHAVERSLAEMDTAIVQVEDTDRQIPVDRDGLYYIDAMLNGLVVHFVVDSGANTTILTQADARRIGFDPKKMRFRQKVVTANGEAPLAVIDMGEMRIAGKSYANVPMAVIGNAGGVSLLGQDMIARLGGFSIANGILTVRT